MGKTWLAILFLTSSFLCAQTTVLMKRSGGVYQVPCKVNGLPLIFIFDTGASNVSISLTEAMFMLKNGYLKKEDVGESVYYSIANGDVAKGTELNIREIEVGGLKLFNIKASIVHETNAPLLLGQSVIEKLGKIQLDGNQLIILNGLNTSYDYSGSSEIKNATTLKDFEKIKTTASGLKYIVITEGKGLKPTANSNVKVHYVGTLVNGTEFDSSVKRGEPIDFNLNQVIPGWIEGLQLMPEGSKYKFYIPYNLAYGERAMGGVIPAKSDLIFEVELIKINK